MQYIQNFINANLVNWCKIYRRQKYNVDTYIRERIIYAYICRCDYLAFFINVNVKHTKNSAFEQEKA